MPQIHPHSRALIRNKYNTGYTNVNLSSTLYGNTRKVLHKHRNDHRGKEAQTDTQRRQQERQDKTEGDERIQTEHQTAQQDYRALVTRVPMRKHREYARDDWKHRKKTAQTRPEIRREMSDQDHQRRARQHAAGHLGIAGN